MGYLKLVANPADMLSLNRVVNSPKRGIGAVTVNKFLSFANANHYNVLEAMDNIGASTISTRPASKLSDFGSKLRDAIKFSKDHTVTGLTEKKFLRILIIPVRLKPHTRLKPIHV